MRGLKQSMWCGVMVASCGLVLTGCGSDEPTPTDVPEGVTQQQDPFAGQALRPPDQPDGADIVGGGGGGAGIDVLTPDDAGAGDTGATGGVTPPGQPGAPRISGGDGGGGAAPVPTREATFAGLLANVPEAWEAKEATSEMRAAVFTVPTAHELFDDGELIVFYFGEDQGGTVEMNVQRWTNQFRTASGDMVSPRITRETVAGMSTVIVELTGVYDPGAAMGGSGPLPGSTMMMQSIVEGPRGKVFIRMLGPAEAVQPHRDHYLRMIRSLRPAS